MTYKVTALKDVTIRAYVRGKTAVEMGGRVFMKPSEREEWISLSAGEVVRGLGLVIATHPASVPNVMPLNVHGISMVIGDSWGNEDLPKEFFGLYRLEVDEP
jgi:hypothetical protein